MKMKLLSLAALCLSTTTYSWGFSVYEADAVWEKPEVRVCFGSRNEIYQSELPNVFNKGRLGLIRSFSSQEKMTLKKIVNAQFTKERTGIRFIGWQDCQSLAKNQYDAILYTFDINDSRRADSYMKTLPFGHSSIGNFESDSLSAHAADNNYINPTPKGVKKHLVISQGKRNPKQAISTTFRIKHTAIHEFGHLAGLRHELVHPDSDGSRGERIGTACYSESYDPYSVMNYDYSDYIFFNGVVVDVQMENPDPEIFEELTNGTLKYKGGLSSGDIAQLKELYPAEN